MSTVDAKPVVPAEASAVEPTPAPVAPVVEADKPVESVEPAKTEEPAKVEGEAAAATEEKKEEKAEEKKEEKVVEPITSGFLGYKAPGLKNAFRFSKRFFWFGEDAVPASSLSQYLRGEKAEVAHPVAAWSTQTGKGLLYFVKHQDQKETPAGVLNLSDATDLAKDGILAFAFKIHGHKHTFEAQSAPERNGWFVAAEKAIEEAKAAKEGVVSSEGYKEQLEKLGKPATLAATSASTPKKSTDVTPKPAETEAAATEEAAPAARAGSSSSSSADEDKKKKSKSKSRSVSRGKRSSIFGGFLGKKDKAEEKHEEKKEEKKEEAEAKEETPAVAEASTTAPVITQDIPKPSEELKAEEPAIVAPATEEKKEEKKEEEKPKPAKRGSIFGSIVKGLKSPTHEKKESEVTPAPAAAAAPAKEGEVAPEAPKIEETPAVAPAVPATEATPAVAEAPKTEETKPATTTPHKEKSSFSFGKFLGGAKEKVKSPTGEKAPELPKTEEPAKTEETPAVAPVAPVEPVAEAPKEEKKEETPKEVAKEEKKDEEKKKRGSIFGSLIRNASKAGKSKKEKETANPPAKVEEAAEPKEEETKTDAPAVAPTEEKKEETPAAPTAAIGDVVPDAVTVGQATKSTPPVATSA